MKTCYIPIGRGIARIFWWECAARKGYSKEFFGENDRVIAVDWADEYLDEEYENDKNYVYVIPQIQLEGNMEEGLVSVWQGKRIISRMAHYSKVFEHCFDSYFDTDELQLVFLTSSVGDFLMGETPEIINYLISKISCTFPQCKLHVRTIVYSNEFYKERKLNPGEVMFMKTGWFLDRYMAEKGKRKYLCSTDEVYVIDKDCCAFDDLFYSIGLSSEMLKKMDRTEMVRDRKGM